jgi:multidrug efflux pump subunit AcrB
LAFSRVIDNSVISLENIYRHLEMGSSPAVAAEQGGAEVNLAVLAATLVDVVDFFPVTFLFGVSKFLFSALALAFCLSIMASFVVAMTVIPLFCSRYLRGVHHEIARQDSEEGPLGEERLSWGSRFNHWFNRMFNGLLDHYERCVRAALKRPALTVTGLMGLFFASFAIYPFLGLAFFPRTDAGQFTINLKAPAGTRLEATDQYVAKIEDLIRKRSRSQGLPRDRLQLGVVNDFSSLYTTNAGQYTATIQTQLTDDHKTESQTYMDRIRDDIAARFPNVRAFFQSGSMVNAILNSGMPAPIDVQVSSRDLRRSYRIAQELASRIRSVEGVGNVYIPQDMNYPALRMNVDRVHAGELGLSQKDVVDNVITALDSNIMIAPNYWVDYKSGNDYFLTVQYYEHGQPAVHNLIDLRQIPLRAPNVVRPTTLDSVVKLESTQSPTEVDHYQIQRVIDVYVTPAGEDLGKVTKSDPEDCDRREASRQCVRRPTRNGERHGGVLQEFCHRLHAFFHPAVSYFDCAVPVFHRPVPDHAGHTDGLHRRPRYSAAHSHDAERYVADGCSDADRHR